jgi:hypothetical protein
MLQARQERVKEMSQEAEPRTMAELAGRPNSCFWFFVVRLVALSNRISYSVPGTNVLQATLTMPAITS